MERILHLNTESMVYCISCEKDVPREIATTWKGYWVCRVHFAEHKDSDIEELF